ncbi:hypothetical protein V6N11_072781 [Hibiscus sabdariffa]|uniref:Uncharacterized protein n=2 Tax=Hibiscus sabdariffa TaxID=183260 RepID=A0ABR2C739_9ROSI
MRKSDGKILQVEASKNLVHLVFSFLTIALESVLDLILGAKGNLTLGSISNLFRDLKTIFSISEHNIFPISVLPPFYHCPSEFPNIRSRYPPAHIIYYYMPVYKGESSVRKIPLDPKSPELSTEDFIVSNQNNSQKGVLPPFYSCPVEFPNIRSRDPPQYYYCYNVYNLSNVNREYRVINKPIDPKSPKWITVNSLGYLEKKSFVVTDDLVVEPLSSFSSVSLLMELGISDQSN